MNAPASTQNSVATVGWDIISLGKDIKVYARDREIKKPVVIDIGSNSVKLVVYGLCESPPRVIVAYDRHCGLGAGMTHDDPKPRLNEGGLRILFDEFLPASQNIIKEQTPDGFIVMCTEAVRASHENPDERKNVERFLNKIAHSLCVPREAINILSKALEAYLAAETALCADLNDIYGIMMGGGSSEFFQIIDRKIHPDRCSTLRFGTRSLYGDSNAAQIINEEFNLVPWFRDNERINSTPDHRTRLCLLGGAFRFVGRLLAERIDKINFAADTPFGGYTFAWGKELEAHVRNLRGATHETLFNHTFGAPKPEGLQRVRIAGTTYVKVKDTFVEKSNFDRMCKKWEKRIGRRAASISVATQTILEAGDRLRPRTINFSPHNMREAALRYTGLAYM
jgi:histone H3/H4